MSYKDLWYNYITSLPLGHQAVYTIVVLHQQVSNGGLHQYFFNSYGLFAYLTVEHLKLIGAINTANILEHAIKEVNTEGYSVSVFQDKIFNRQLDRISNFDEDLVNSLQLLDNEYDDSEEDLEHLLGTYLINVSDNIID